MNKLYMFLLLSLCACSVAFADESNKKDEIALFFNTMQWQVAFENAGIEKKSFQKVYVLTSFDEVKNLCADNLSFSEINGSKKFYSANDSRWAFGVLCDQRVILLGSGILDIYKDENQVAFISIHEGFHLIYQYGLGKQPIELLISERPSYLEIPDSEKKLLEAAMQKAVYNQDCSKAVNLFNTLQGNTKKYLNFVSYYEWPAEYFAEKAIKSLDKQAYSKMKNGSNYDQFYQYGPLIGGRLDKSAIRDWKRRVQDGENMLNIYLESTGCQKYFTYSSYSKAKINLFKDIK